MTESQKFHPAPPRNRKYIVLAWMLLATVGIVSSASAQEVSGEVTWEGTLVGVEHNKWNDVKIILPSGSQPCGINTSSAAYVLEAHAGAAKEGMLKTLLAAFAGNYRVLLKSVVYQLNGSDVCAIRRVRITR